MNLKEALEDLDPLNPDHWTQNGDPRLDMLKERVGTEVTRKEVTDLFPKFNRQNPITDIEEKADPPEQPDPFDDENDVDLDTEVLSRFIELSPMTEKQYAQFLKDEIEDGHLESVEEILLEQMQSAEESLKKAQELISTLKVGLAYTRSHIKARIPDVPTQDAIRAYIRSQQKLRQDRSDLSQEIRKAGIDISKLDPRAPIDRAMARKTSRGAKRPTRV